MPLESGTFVADLVATNPPGTDAESQGANHLRLIKSVLQGTFPGASKAWPFPTSATKTNDYSVVKADFNVLFLIDTSVNVPTMTLPTLTAGDAGWTASFLKTTSVGNPFFIAPPSGTIQSGELTGLTRTRRYIPGRPTTVFWTGSAFVCTRVPSVPVGCLLPYGSATFPQPTGYEYPNGQTLSTTLYPDYAKVTNNTGATIDMRGKAPFGVDNMGGSAAGIITVAGSGLDGTSQGSTGGAQNKAIASGNLPVHTHTIPANTGDTTPDHLHNIQYQTALGNIPAGGVPFVKTIGPASANANGNADSTAGATMTHHHTQTGPTGDGGFANTALVTLSPAAMTYFLLVVE